MGMIAPIKSGYKIMMVDTLLVIFVEEGGYDTAAKHIKFVHCGYTVLDAMNILVDIWGTKGE